MADELKPDVIWEVEDIPNESTVFMRAHRSHFIKESGELRPGVFRDQGAAMSVDWDKYATPEATGERAKVPADNAVLALNVGAIREIDTLRVIHEPLAVNRAHSGVHGEKTEEVRVKLLRRCEVKKRLG